MKIGDKVAVTDDELHGTVTSVHGDSVVFVDVHGFTHRFPKNKIVVQDTSLYDGITVFKKSEAAKISSKKHNKAPLVLDLHFEKLVSDPSEYNSFERLLIQKEKLIETVHFCRKNNLKKLEIIHGIGDGVLQKMVYDYLDSQTGLEYIVNEIFYHQTGSTLVTFQ